MLNVHKTAIVVGLEPEDGVNATDGYSILAHNLEITPLETEQFTRDPMTTRLGSYTHMHTGLRGRIAFQVDLTPPKDKGNVPAFHNLLLACGYKHSEISGTTTQQYTLGDKIPHTLTIMAFLDGLLHRFSGARGNLQFIIKLHETPTMQFEFLGHWENPFDVGAAPVNFDQFLKPIIVDSHSTSLTVDNKAVPARLLEINTGNSIDYLETLDSKKIILSNRRSSGNLIFSVGSVSEFNPTQSISSNFISNHKLKLLYTGSQKVEIKMPYTQWHQHSLSSEGNQWFHRVALGISDNETDTSPITLELT